MPIGYCGESRSEAIRASLTPGAGHLGSRAHFSRMYVDKPHPTLL